MGTPQYPPPPPGEKGELLKCVEPVANVHTLNTPDVDVRIFDVVALVHTLHPRTAKTNVKIF